MFYEHRLYFDMLDPKRIPIGRFAIEGRVLGLISTQVEGVPLFRFQTEEPLDAKTRKRLTVLMQPSFAAWNDESAMSFEKYQQWREVQTVLDPRTLACLDAVDLQLDQKAAE